MSVSESEMLESFQIGQTDGELFKRVIGHIPNHQIGFGRLQFNRDGFAIFFIQRRSGQPDFALVGRDIDFHKKRVGVAVKVAENFK